MANLDKNDVREFNNALKELTVEVRTNTIETKAQTEYFKNNGFTEVIIGKLTRRFAAIISIVAAVTGFILYII